VSEHTVAFRATREALNRIVPGWLPPLAEPLRIQRINPFTRKAFTKTTDDPRDVEGFVEQECAQPDFANVAHASIGSFGLAELEVLSALAGVRIKLPVVLFPTQRDSYPLFELPRAACDMLSRLAGGDVRALAERWVVDPDLIIPAFGSSRVDVDAAEQVLTSLRALCVARSDDERIYFYSES
jgi:hypothetical protein